jgi:hypothetical protein
MTDRELLELAAKAAGIDVICGHDELGLYPGGMVGPWNPITDDGDAFRLAHAVPMIVTPGTARLLDGRLFGVDCNDSAATRRAIVRAAAMAPTGEKP